MVEEIFEVWWVQSDLGWTERVSQQLSDRKGSTPGLVRESRECWPTNVRPLPLPVAHSGQSSPDTPHPPGISSSRGTGRARRRRTNGAPPTYARIRKKKTKPLVLVSPRRTGGRRRDIIAARGTSAGQTRDPPPFLPVRGLRRRLEKNR